MDINTATSICLFWEKIVIDSRMMVGMNGCFVEI